MAINHFSITGTVWTAITTAGQSGVCWLTKGGVTGNGNCVIFHTTGTPDVDDIEFSYPVYELKGQNKAEIISADSDSDVYYAITTDANATCTLVTDVV